MTTLETAGKTIEIDDEGFLSDADEWTPELAEVLAEVAGLGPMSDLHWKVITLCREDAARKGRPPGLRRISKLSGVGMEELRKLFPGGCGELAVKLAGLPGSRPVPGPRGPG